MRKALAVVAIVAIGTLVAACSGAGYGGGGAAVTQVPAATTAAAAPPTAVATPSAAPSAAAASSGGFSDGGRGAYGYGGGGSTVAASVPPGTVALEGYAFAPATIAVAKGASVTFTNQDVVAHAIVIGDGGTPAAGQSPVRIAPGQSGAITFPTAGTVKLTCTIHPSMSMTVTVGP